MHRRQGPRLRLLLLNNAETRIRCHLVVPQTEPPNIRDVLEQCLQPRIWCSELRCTHTHTHTHTNTHTLSLKTVIPAHPGHIKRKNRQDNLTKVNCWGFPYWYKSIPRSWRLCTDWLTTNFQFYVLPLADPKEDHQNTSHHYWGQSNIYLMQ